jgi:hypothetical protein
MLAFGGKADIAIAIGTARLLTQSGLSHRGSNRSRVSALPRLAGALSTVAHAGGKSLSLKPLADPELSGIFSRRTQSANQ